MSAQGLLESGIDWKSGSPASNRTGAPGLMIFQFIVNDMVIQSLSRIAVRGWALSLNEFAGPETSSLEPAGLVRKRNGVFQVIIPAPNSLLTHRVQISADSSNWKSMLSGLEDPRQVAVKPTGFLTHKPVWLAIVIGRQR